MIEPSRAAPVVEFGFGDGRSRPSERRLAAEVPVAIGYGDIPYAVMMTTPADLDDFAYGFSLTEGVIERAADIRGVAAEEGADGAVRLGIDLVAARLHAHLARRRAMAGRTSCGLCGLEDLDHLPRARKAEGTAPRLRLGAIDKALRALDDRQALNAATRAVHGAAWADAAGHIVAVREDVGRHNALDKLLGACLRSEVAPADGFAVVTSRASYEMVEKAAAFGCRSLVAISAPTAFAVERARALDITLVAIARRDSVAVFHGAERIVTGAYR